jgi:hypothetical protein
MISSSRAMSREGFTGGSKRGKIDRSKAAYAGGCDMDEVIMAENVTSFED